MKITWNSTYRDSDETPFEGVIQDSNCAYAYYISDVYDDKGHLKLIATVDQFLVYTLTPSEVDEDLEDCWVEIQYYENEDVTAIVVTDTDDICELIKFKGGNHIDEFKAEIEAMVERKFGKKTEAEESKKDVESRIREIAKEIERLAGCNVSIGLIERVLFKSTIGEDFTMER